MPTKRRRRRKTRIKIFITLVIAIVAVIAGALGLNEYQKSTLPDSTQVEDGEAVLHFIDVGQADSILIQMANGNVLIDAGTNDSETDLKRYLDAQGIQEIEYAIFTHPHEDHIGGADMVLKNYKVKNVVLPNVTHTSKTYLTMIDCIESCGANTIIAEPEKTFKVDAMSFTILAPISSSYTDLNNTSVVLKAVYGSTSFMFTGDAETVSEEEILARFDRESLKCDLLKVGHHGSDSSTSKDFLGAVSPRYAVIQCGKGNSYGHPKAEILTRLENANVKYYRTDLEGSIVFVSDGINLTKKD